MSIKVPIYKINHLVQGKIDTIFVFYGSVSDSERKVFSEKETAQIQQNQTKVVYSTQQIHLDDTIGAIKIKIFNELKTQISLEEIYLFCEKLETIHSVSLYQSLTQNKKIELTKTRLYQFLDNIVSDKDGNPFVKPNSKEIYDYQDILELNMENRVYIINKVLGQKFFIIENEYPFVCNPYQVEEYDPFFERVARKSVSTLNNQLLLNTGPIIDNNIYLCLAKDVLTYTSNVSEENTLKIYYPFLYSKNINDLEKLEEIEPSLIEANKKISDKLTDTFSTIDMFYDVYALQKKELNYLDQGIRFVKAVLKPTTGFTIPLEVIFKILHATEQNPLIKYNPSTRQENVYRLYTDKISIDGRKIPFLKKAIIFKLIRNIGKNKSVSVYIENTNVETLVCEFNENGNITIIAELHKRVGEEEINSLFVEYVNPVIDEIKNYLEQSGYKIDNFHSLRDENVDIEQLTYESEIKITKPLNLEGLKGCVSSVFINETNPAKHKDIYLRFKRVSNFNKVTSQEAFVLEKQEEGLRGDEIIEALLDNFNDLTHEEAVDLVRKVANEIQVERGVRRSDIKIKNNPGFKTVLKTDKTNVLTITVENINDIYYLSTIPIYLDTMIRLTQNKESTKYPLENINRICSSGEKEDIPFTDIVSPVESVTSEENEKNNLFDQFFGDEEEEEEYRGGVNSDSDASIASFQDSSGESKMDSESEPSPSEKELPALIVSPSDSVKLEPLNSPDSEKSELTALNSPDSVKLESEASVNTFESEKSEPLNSPDSEKLESESSVKSEKSEPLNSPDSVKLESEPSVNSFKSEKSELPALIVSPSDSVKLESEPSVNTFKSEKSEPLNSLDSEKLESEASVNSFKSEKSEPMNSPDSVKLESESSVESEKSELPALNSPSDSVKLESEASVQSEKELPMNSPDSVKLESEKAEEEEKEEEPEEEEKTEEEEKPEKNIDGMSLRNYFQNQIEDKDKKIIIKQDIGNYSSYSKVCQSSAKRQPVILTDEELNKINKEHKGFLREEDVIKYGSEKDKTFNYICPRYWCLKTKTIIEPNEFKEVMENGKKVLVHPTCGKIIPEKADKIPPGHYVYEFYKGKNNRYPNFQVDKHPDGLCLPCCFDKWNTAAKIKSKNKCYKKEMPEEKGEPEEKDEYVKGPEKFPLSPLKWGYLPLAVQTILNEVNANCQISKTNTNLKKNHTCLLRHGVEINETQSFIACISDALFFGKKVSGDSSDKKVKILTIVEMKKRIQQSLNIDDFIRYQNGNLVNDFQKNPDSNLIDKYKNTKLYAKLNMNKKEDVVYYTNVVSAFENFLRYLDDNKEVINHEYLWDIVCSPNKYIFPEGRNLVLFNIPNNDITNNIEIVCPSNHYSNEIYDARRPTLFIVKQENYYEPIYSYMISDKRNSLQKAFSEYDNNLPKSFKNIFTDVIKPLYKNVCKPLESMTQYSMQQPILLSELLQILEIYKYKIIKKVSNFRNKIIGVIAETPDSGKIGYVPCYPSAVDDNYVFMSETDLWNTYENTFVFLSELNTKSKMRKNLKEIPCKPVYKIVEDGMVVGILTNSNQFVQISQPIPEMDVSAKYDIPSFKNTNYIVDTKTIPNVQSDIYISTNQEPDKERVEYIEKIRLETNFYNIFRNTIRILLNDYENAKIKDNLEAELLKEYIIYSQKMKIVIGLLKGLVQNKIQFIGDKNYYKLIQNVSTCIVKNNSQCKDTPNLCTVSDNGACNLILPEKNLMTGKNNVDIYYDKMADELLRYNRIKSFIFKPQSYLTFGNIKYNLRENEIILLQSLITQEYFETFVPSVTNNYVLHKSYDEMNPQISKPYSNVITYLDIGKEKPENCEKEENRISSTIWKTRFPSNFKDSSYGKNNLCNFQLFIDIAKNVSLSINQIKHTLLDEYKKLFELNPDNMDKILDILILEGKKKMGEQVKAENNSFENFIYADNYFLTPFDLWVLVEKYKIPTIFISQKYILQTNYERQAFVCYGDRDASFIFILIPGLKNEIAPLLKVILNEKNDFVIPLDSLKDGDIIKEAFENKKSISTYLNDFTKKPTTKYTKRKPILRLQEDMNEEEPGRIAEEPGRIAEEPGRIAEEPGRIAEEEKEEPKTIKAKPKKRLVIHSPVPDELITITKKKKTKIVDVRKTKKVRLVIST